MDILGPESTARPIVERRESLLKQEMFKQGAREDHGGRSFHHIMLIGTDSEAASGEGIQHPPVRSYILRPSHLEAAPSQTIRMTYEIQMDGSAVMVENANPGSSAESKASSSRRQRHRRMVERLSNPPADPRAARVAHPADQVIQPAEQPSAAQASAPIQAPEPIIPDHELMNWYDRIVRPEAEIHAELCRQNPVELPVESQPDIQAEIIEILDDPPIPGPGANTLDGIVELADESWDLIMDTGILTLAAAAARRSSTS